MRSRPCSFDGQAMYGLYPYVDPGGECGGLAARMRHAPAEHGVADHPHPVRAAGEGTLYPKSAIFARGPDSHRPCFPIQLKGAPQN